MRGEMDREGRAKGGIVKANSRQETKKSFFSPKPKGDAPDATLKRGKGIFRKRGGKVDEEDYKRGGKVEGKGKKPHMGRAGRARGGGVGSDCAPLTSASTPAKPKERHIMPESEATP